MSILHKSAIHKKVVYQIDIVIENDIDTAGNHIKKMKNTHISTRTIDFDFTTNMYDSEVYID